MPLKNKYIRLSTKNRLHHINIPIIGLTGGIATGKSTVAKILLEKGYAVIDADQLVKKIYHTEEAKEFVNSLNPNFLQDGKIQFTLLREQAFTRPELLSSLEAFLYQRMPEFFNQALATFNPCDFCIYDVPLLFEKNLDPLVDISICVYAPLELQIERLIARDGIDKGLAEKIIGQQMSIEEKKKKANFILENVGDKNELNNHVDHCLRELLV